MSPDAQKRPGRSQGALWVAVDLLVTYPCTMETSYRVA